MKSYTALEHRYLRRYYPHAPTAQLAARLQRTPRQLHDYARTRSLRKQVHPTHFRPGHDNGQANPLGDGALHVEIDQQTGRAYLWRRTSLGRRQQEHRYQWQQAHGPIPPGHVLRCRSADTLNCDPANWELLTRAEHARRNEVGTVAAGPRLTDAAVAGHLARCQPGLQRLLLACPPLLALKRQQLLLARLL